MIKQQYKICYKSTTAFGCISPFYGRKHAKKFQKKQRQKYYFSVGRMVDMKKFEGYDWGLYPFIGYD